MLKKLAFISFMVSVGFFLNPSTSYAQDNDDNNNGFGQSIQIYTRFSSFIGKPTWLLIIRDLDHGENIPYLFDIRRGNNFWIAFSYSKNYLITVSRMQIPMYQPRCNTTKVFHINNFCHLESNDHIIRGNSMYITITGDLSADSSGYTCNVSSFPNANFSVASQGEFN